MEEIRIKEAARMWGISERRVIALCKAGKIDGARREGKFWLIPANAEKPTDSRFKEIPTVVESKVALPLPIGVSDYRLASKAYYYVDKTLMIRDFLDEKPMVSLFTRPRRFGKTLNMDMLRVYFEKTKEDTSVYFRDKLIWKEGKKYQEHQGQYPVIFISFKDVKKGTWEKTLDHIIQIISAEYKRHVELEGSTKIQDGDYYAKIISGSADRELFDSSLYMLSKMLHEHYGKAPIVIIDEYDTPIQQGHTEGFYEEVILFMRNLFSGVLKDNKHLSYGFLTGILRVAKESIFSGLNNLTVNSILDEKYSAYFGFTEEEVEKMAKYYGAGDKMAELCEWYDGYRFGNEEIFNPWSVINYFRNNCRVGTYWQSTGSNDIIGEILTQADEIMYERLNLLLQGKTILTSIDTGVVYPQIKENPSTVYSFLLVAGYLKAAMCDTSFNGDFMCEVAIPNKEITLVYNKEILQKITHIIPQSIAISIQEALYSGNGDDLQKYMERLLLQSASCYDTVGENFYHGLVLGLCAVMDNCYYITSNRESGTGRYDIQLMPKQDRYPGILIELKAGKNADEPDLQTLADVALKQIEDRRYDTDMKAKGVREILKYGVGFSGKNVVVKVKKEY